MAHRHGGEDCDSHFTRCFPPGVTRGVRHRLRPDPGRSENGRCLRLHGEPCRSHVDEQLWDPCPRRPRHGCSARRPPGDLRRQGERALATEGLGFPRIPAFKSDGEHSVTHSLRPRLIDAADAHRNGEITYDAEGNAHLHSEGMRIPPTRQYAAIRATFDDLNKAVSSQANSPSVGGQSLRARYEQEAERYEALVVEAMAEGKLEPDYGTYVYDAARQELYLVAPEPWHRLALVTS